MKTLTPPKSPLLVRALDDPDEHGKHADYSIEWSGRAGLPTAVRIYFQRGPVKKNGANGVTDQALAAILLDRLTSTNAKNGEAAARRLAIHKSFRNWVSRWERPDPMRPVSPRRRKT